MATFWGLKHMSNHSREEHIEIQLTGSAEFDVEALAVKIGEMRAAGWEDLRLFTDSGYDCSGLYLTGMRPETAAEKKTRLKAEDALAKRRQAQKDQKKQQDLKELARLKALYEDV